MKAYWKEQLLAQSDDTIMVENNHYFPPESLDTKYFITSDKTSRCPWKGTANYYSINVDDDVNKDAAWYYSEPKQAAMDMIAYGRIGVGNMEAIMQLDADSQNKTIAMAYEVLIQNESRMNKISDAVVNKLEKGETVSDIHLLANISQSEFIDDVALKLTQEKKVVPLIQKR